MKNIRIATKNTFVAKLLTFVSLSFFYYLMLSVNFANAASNNVLGNAQEFSAYVFSDFKGNFGIAYGGLAVGGNLQLARYNIAKGGDISPLAYSLLVEGDARYSSGKIHSGKVRVAGNISGISNAVINRLPEGTTIENAPLEYSIKNSQAFYQALADSLSVLSVNGQVTKTWAGLYLKGDCTSPLQVFELDSAAIKNAFVFKVSCIPDDATVIFNITGNKAVFKFKRLSTLTKHRNRVIFNFYQAEKLKLTGIIIEGTILAPNAEIKANFGAVMGTVIAKSWQGTMHLRNVPFIGEVSLDDQLDRDGDGVPDDDDAFPDDPTESVDSDSDGVGDNSDVFPLDPTETSDLDGDGVGDNADVFPLDPTETSDSDGDGVGDNADVFPNDATETADLDGDGVGDNSDPDIDGDSFTNVFEQEKGTDPYNADDFPDTVTPKLALNSTTPIEVEDSFFVVSGIAEDTIQPYSGINSIVIESDRYPEANFTGSYDSNNGAFAIEVPLKALVNVIKVIAQDYSGNETYAQLVINRDPAPALMNILPTNGSVTTLSTTTISGEIFSILPVSALTFWMDEWQLTPTTTNTANVYAFSIPEVNLAHGMNSFTLTVKSASNKQDQKILNINYTAENADEIAAPTITLNSPSDGALLNQDSFRLSALIQSSAGPLTVTFNGNVIVDAASELTRYNLNELVTFNDAESVITASIVVTDSLNKTSNKELTFYRDISEPIILLESPLSSTETNRVSGSPYVMKGTISDDNLASVLFNDEAVTLEPTGIDNTYAFSVSIPIASQTTIPVTISAYDQSGNRKRVEYQLYNDEVASLVPLMPAQDSEYITKGDPISVQVVARMDGILGGETASVQFLSDTSSDNNLSTPVNMDISGTLASGTITLPAVAAPMKIIISLHNSSGELITQSEIAVQVTSLADVPVEVVRVEPINNSDYIEPNSPVEIYFNREIDLSLLSVQVRETLHGKTYINEDDLGTDYLSSEGYKLVGVHRNLMPVQGQIELNPGGTGVAFYADKLFGFNAEVYVDVMYDSKEISRSFFSVRELPTLINGAVADQFGQPLAGIKVEIPELGRKTTTNGDGGFAFGYQESGEQVIPSGQYTLVVNNNFTSANLGMINTKISVQRNYGNNLARLTLQELDRNIAFQNITSGQVNNLVGGDLILDLTQAKVLFDKGRTDGAAHMQFLPFEHIGARMWPGAVPLWIYSSQPKGVTVEGDISLTLSIPKLSGSHNYLSAESYPYVVLVGYNANQQVIEPIGVGRVENNKVVSVGTVNLTSLDFIGYAQVHQHLAEALISYAEGDVSIQQLKAQLQAVLQEEG